MQNLYIYIKCLINLLKKKLGFNLINNRLKKNTPLNIPIDIIDFKNILEYLYQNRSGYITDLNREDPELVKQHIFLTYGEILPEGLNRLFDYVNINNNDSFVDLGSGAGKTVLQSYLCTNIKNSYGVEIDLARHNVAIDALNDLKQNYNDIIPGLLSNRDRNIEFLNINIKDFDFSKASILFCNATCYSGGLMDFIKEQVEKNTNIRAVMSTQKIHDMARLANETIIEIETSWHVPPNKSNCYVYMQ